MNPFEAIAEAQRKLLRSTAWQILVMAVCQLIISVQQELPMEWISLSLVLAFIALPPLLSNADQRKLAIGFILPLAVFALAAPWQLGGLRHPMTLLPIVALHTGAFLLGVRVALWMAGASLVNLLALLVCEHRGLLAGVAPSPETILLYFAVFTVQGLLFMSVPLNLVRKLLVQAATDLQSRRENEAGLLDLTDELEIAVDQRRDALTRTRGLLHQSVDDVATSMRSSITGLLEASRELAESFSSDAGEARWMAFRIASGCERMETMHNSLHRFCKLGEEALSLRPLSPQAHTGMVHRIWSEIRSLQPDRTISFFLDPIPQCVCDADLLRQVWQNLLSNAAKSTLTTPAACVRVYFRDGEFCVEDNGAGFDMAWAQNLFGVFKHQHADREFGGVGIGLAMARRIVELHGGGIRADSQPGHGAVFRFQVPSEVV